MKTFTNFEKVFSTSEKFLPTLCNNNRYSFVYESRKKKQVLGFPKGIPLWSLQGKVGGLGEGKTTHRKSLVFLPPNSLPASQS